MLKIRESRGALTQCELEGRHGGELVAEAQNFHRCLAVETRGRAVTATQAILEVTAYANSFVLRYRDVQHCDEAHAENVPGLTLHAIAPGPSVSRVLRALSGDAGSTALFTAIVSNFRTESELPMPSSVNNTFEMYDEL